MRRLRATHRAPTALLDATKILTVKHRVALALLATMLRAPATHRIH